MVIQSIEVNKNKTLSLVVPTLNMQNYLQQLLDSVKLSGLYDNLKEIVIVNDGSSDHTEQIVLSWKKINDLSNKVICHTFLTNQGRFNARFVGANRCSTTHIIFLDTRIQVPSKFNKYLFDFLADHEALMASLRIDQLKSVYNLYWLRTHEFIFKKSWHSVHSSHMITAQNYSEHVVGTGGFICRRDDFLQACSVFENQNLISDDTALIYEIVKRSSIYRDERLYLNWEPRQTLSSFLSYIFLHRGKTFADYHLLTRWGKLSWIFLIATLVFAGTIFLAFQNPKIGLSLFLAEGTLVLLSTILFSKTIFEFIQMAGLHIAVVACYGFGTLWGMVSIGIGKLKSSNN